MLKNLKMISFKVIVGLMATSVGCFSTDESKTERDVNQATASLRECRVAATSDKERSAALNAFHIREGEKNTCEVLTNTPAWKVSSFNSYEEALSFANQSVPQPYNLTGILADHEKVMNKMLPTMQGFNDTVKSLVPDTSFSYRLKTLESFKNKLFNRVKDSEKEGKEFKYEWNINDLIAFRFVAPNAANTLAIKNTLAGLFSAVPLLDEKPFIRGGDKDQTWYIRGAVEKLLIEVQVWTIPNLAWLDWQHDSMYKASDEFKAGDYYKKYLKPYKGRILDFTIACSCPEIQQMIKGRSVEDAKGLLSQQEVALPNAEAIKEEHRFDIDGLFKKLGAL